MMLKTNLIVLSCLLSSLPAGGQCGTIDFTLPSTGCIGQDINVAPISAYLDYEWDFCAGDFDQTPTASTFYSAAGSAFKVELVEQGGQYFGFYTSRNNGKLYRLDFGTDITSSPTPIDLGGLGISSNTWLTIEIVKEGSEYYGFIIDFFNKVYRFRFGSSIINAPMDAEELYSNALLANPIDLVVLEDESGKYLFVANFNSNKITRFEFASSFGEVIGSTIIDEVAVTGSGNLSGISFIRECNVWYAVATSISGGDITKIVFGAGLSDNNPGLSQVNGLPFVPNSPGGIALAFENNKYYAFIQSQQTQSNLYKIDFGNSMANAPLPSSADLGNFGLLNNVFGFSMFKVKSDWLVLGSENTGQNIYRISFPNRCFSNLKYSTTTENIITSTTGSGTYYVSLESHNAMGYVLSASKSITFSSNTPPDISFSSQNVCVNNDVNFAPVNTSGDITNYSWFFGDSQTSTNPNPTHQYAATGDYIVSLQVTASNGCNNYVENTISIFDEPIPDFLTPASPLCSNQTYLFENTSVIDPGYPVSWQWSVNGVNQSTSEDLNFSFTLTSTHDVTLTASIPGCENSVTKTIGPFAEGPLPDFSFSGQCEDENVTFTNSSSGTIDGYSWNFNDGSPNASDPNPIHVFSTIGVYDVTLTATNTTSGCNNTKTKSVPVYSIPSVNFLLSPPPFSCNGTPSQFNDLTPTPTDSNLASWSWNFDDAGSSQNTSTLKNPQHSYANAGMYTVSLLVTTNFLCSATIQLPVTISQTPTASFNNGPPCEDVAVAFSDTSPGTIQSWNWSIGDTNYTTQNPSHIFINSGSTSATLSVTASNGCIGSTVPKLIIVPAKLNPDFTVFKNCVNQQTVFTDITNATADPISSHSWTFGQLGTATGSPATFTFLNTGNVNVIHTVTTQTGCVYPVSKTINIIPSPQADFTASPMIGAVPLAVQFTNTSTNATSYLWEFRDASNSTSTQISPMFTYTSLGEYPAQLTAFNIQNCSHSSGKTIQVVIPVFNVELGGLELMELQNGSFKPAVTIFNNGNVPISNLGLLIDMAGPVIRERINSTIMPNTSYRYVFSFEFLYQEGTNYFCVEAEIDDITPMDDRVCMNFEQPITTFPPYPNPTKGEMQVDWIMKEDGIVNLTLVNSMGQEVRNIQVNSDEGLNPFRIDSKGLATGAYFLKIKFQHFTEVYRVFISE